MGPLWAREVRDGRDSEISELDKGDIEHPSKLMLRRIVTLYKHSIELIGYRSTFRVEDNRYRVFR